jgi:hypothetical protein
MVLIEPEDAQVVIEDPVNEERFFDESEVEEEEVGVDHEESGLTTWEEDLLPFMIYFERNFPAAILVDKHPGFIHYHIRRGKTTYSKLFTKMEEAKVVVGHVTSYYIGETNLDQVFINFVAGQRPYD